MTNLKKFIHLFSCPQCSADVELADSAIVCKSNGEHVYPIVDNIPRFTECSKDAYEHHWKEFSSSDNSNKFKLIEAETFVNWLLDNNAINQNVLDIGCGDGFHIPFVPENILYVAVDRTPVVDQVKDRYKDRPNLLVVQADALNLPFRDGSFDSIFSYGCINYIPDTKKAILEIERILKNKNTYALWGYGNENLLLRNLFVLTRSIYRILPEPLKSIMLNAMVPMLLLIPNTSGINPFHSSWKQCREIVSTNLSPEFLKILGKDGWDEYVNEYSTKIADYPEKAGAIYKKNDQ